MISVVVVGRNDNHGYNLSKRVSSSLNSMAYFLTEEDEIIFVDWNTPVGYPAMPISIQDDLLEKTKKIMRIIRVSPNIHKKVTEQSTRALVEPLARNVGIRRAKKDSNWILSTNTDILFSSPNKMDIRSLLSKLEPNLWVSTRFELPEFVWETLDRRDPVASDFAIQRWYKSQRFIKRIRVDEGKLSNFLIPDAVGDFQLATRDLWEAVRGFPEDMKQGWHVDTRLTLQMAKKCGISPSLISENDLLVFHQNHLRNLTVYHDSDEANPVEDVYKPYVNLDAWGLANETLDEIKFDRNRNLVEFLESTPFKLGENKSREIAKFVSLEEELRHLSYDITHVINYLADEISFLPNGSRVHCFTSNAILIDYLESMAVRMKFDVFFPDIRQFSKAAVEDTQNVELLILDYGVATSIPLFSPHYSKRKSSRAKNAGLIAISTKMIAERYRNPETRVCCIRAQNWGIRSLVRSYFALPLFNNFTSILSGTIKLHPKINLITNTIILGGVIADYGLSAISQRIDNFERPALTTRAVGNLLVLYRNYLPASARKIVKKVFKILESI